MGKKTQTKKKTSCKPSQTPWIIIAEENRHLEVVKLVHPWGSLLLLGGLEEFKSLHVKVFLA